MKHLLLIAAVVCIVVGGGIGAVAEPSVLPTSFTMPEMTQDPEDGYDIDMTPDVENNINNFCKGSPPRPAEKEPKDKDVKMVKSDDGSNLRKFRPRGGHWVRKLRCKVYYSPYWRFCCWNVWWWVWW